MDMCFLEKSIRHNSKSYSLKISHSFVVSAICYYDFSVADVKGYRPVNTYGLINVYPKSGGER